MKYFEKSKEIKNNVEVTTSDSTNTSGELEIVKGFNFLKNNSLGLYEHPFIDYYSEDYELNEITSDRIVAVRNDKYSRTNVYAIKSTDDNRMAFYIVNNADNNYMGNIFDNDESSFEYAPEYSGIEGFAFSNIQSGSMIIGGNTGFYRVTFSTDGFTKEKISFLYVDYPPQIITGFENIEYITSIFMELDGSFYYASYTNTVISVYHVYLEEGEFGETPMKYTRTLVYSKDYSEITGVSNTSQHINDLFMNTSSYAENNDLYFNIYENSGKGFKILNSCKYDGTDTVELPDFERHYTNNNFHYTITKDTITVYNRYQSIERTKKYDFLDFSYEINPLIDRNGIYIKCNGVPYLFNNDFELVKMGFTNNLKNSYFLPKVGLCNSKFVIKNNIIEKYNGYSSIPKNNIIFNGKICKVDMQKSESYIRLLEGGKKDKQVGKTFYADIEMNMRYRQLRTGEVLLDTDKGWYVTKDFVNFNFLLDYETIYENSFEWDTLFYDIKKDCYVVLKNLRNYNDNVFFVKDNNIIESMCLESIDDYAMYGDFFSLGDYYVHNNRNNLAVINPIDDKLEAEINATQVVYITNPTDPTDNLIAYIEGTDSLYFINTGTNFESNQPVLVNKEKISYIERIDEDILGIFSPNHMIRLELPKEASKNKSILSVKIDGKYVPTYSVGDSDIDGNKLNIQEISHPDRLKKGAMGIYDNRLIIRTNSGYMSLGDLKPYLPTITY